MVVAVNSEPNEVEFETLLNQVLISLKSESKKNKNLYLSLLGSKLEKNVFDILTSEAKGTVFENSIELISGQRFPDIVAKKYYGVEVKTTKSNQWKSVGSSVAEGTRVEGVERIFMLFGKMRDPIDFLCKPYEECLSEVVVTHSPRYLIDMNLSKGATIFDKIRVPYDILRKQENPIKTVLDYYKSLLKDGETTWWSGDTESSSKMIIRLWNHLDEDERKLYIVKGFCLFPELLGKSNDKFNRFALWLATKESVVCPNVRDLFSAGGRGSINYNGKIYSNIPGIIMNLSDNAAKIKSELLLFDGDILSEYWGCEIDNTKLYEQWCDLVIFHANVTVPLEFPFKSYIKSL
ncbi:MAG: hypothetical protein LBG19_01600 [Prevotellaceae bacterium]|jgi:hypothetical protein|nr:hypothetical protein [Prevotellaceae bacterium]